MNEHRDEVWAAVFEQRRRVADMLDDLGPEEWNQPSLCDGWTVRDVAAHLTLQQLGPGEAIAMMLRYRGNTPRAIAESSRRRATDWSTAGIAAAIRSTIETRRHSFGVTNRETLIDILVHGADIAVPLHREFPMPSDAAVLAIDRVFTMRWPPPFPVRRVLSAYRLVATDVDWTYGTGPDVRGPIGALLLVSTGRNAALPQLTGDGKAALVEQLRADSANGSPATDGQ
jgi:uncharacterized protein (TIGR03083 family)